MANINLLPEEFRSKDAKDREASAKKTTKVELNLTSPEKTKDKTVKKDFWNKVSGAFTQSVKPSLEKRDVEKSAPSQKKPSTNVKPTMTTHEPSLRENTHKKLEELHNSSVSTEKLSVPKTLVNPHMIDFQKPSTPIEGGEKKEKLQTPEITGHKDKNSESISPSYRPSYPKVQPTVIHETKEGLLSKLSSSAHNIFYKVTHKKESEVHVSVNLMPEHSISFKDVNWGRIGSMFLVSIGAAALITVLWYIILLHQEREGRLEFSALQSEVATLQAQIIQLEDEQQEALLLKNKLDLAQTLLDEHIYWSKFLTLLEDLTLDSVTFDGLTATYDTDIDSGISLSGTTDSLESVFWQRETFRGSPFIYQATVMDITHASEDTLKESSDESSINLAAVTFTIDIKVDLSILRKQ